MDPWHDEVDERKNYQKRLNTQQQTSTNAMAACFSYEVNAFIC